VVAVIMSLAVQVVSVAVSGCWSRMILQLQALYPLMAWLEATAIQGQLVAAVAAVAEVVAAYD